MSLGISNRFTILPHSPHDALPHPEPASSAPAEAPPIQWVPSRYNIRAVADDGRLVLWNSYTGAMSVFGAAQRTKVEGMLVRNGFTAPMGSIVQYLFKRGFIVKAGTNEYRRIQLQFGQKQYRNDVLQLILLASEDCNFRCTYCYEDFAQGTMKLWVRTGIKRLIEKRQHTLRELSISWFGGEPLYGFAAIEDLAPFFQEVARRNSMAFRSTMTTNAYLLTPEVADKLLAWDIDDFQITIDGTQEDHDRSRPSRDGEDTFATIMANLRALAQRPEDYIVTLRFNYDRDNYAKHPEFLDMVEQQFNRDPRFRLRFRPVTQMGGVNDDQLHICGVKETAQLERAMKREAHKRGLVLADEISHVGGVGALVCYAARPYNFLIGASGKLMKCTVDLDKNDRNVVGKISEEGELLIDQDKLALWTEPAFESDGQCKKCVVLPTCQGMYCPALRFQTGESPCTPIRTAAKQDFLELLEMRPAKERGVDSGVGESPVKQPPAT